MRLHWHIAFIASLLGCAESAKNEPAESSKRKEMSVFTLTSIDSLYSIARVDTKSQRVFVVLDATAATDIAIIKQVIKEVKGQYPFPKLMVSFFTDRRYAGFKTELGSAERYSDFLESWVGEYDSQSKEYWIYYGLPDKKRRYRVE